MSPDIQRKAQALDDYLRALQPVADLTLDEYEADDLKRYAAERLIELIVEGATEIGSLLLVETGQPPAPDYYGAFMKLCDIGVVKASVAKQLAPFAGLRNRLVHDYEDIDNAIVHSRIRLAMKVFPAFLLAVREYQRARGGPRTEGT